MSIVRKKATAFAVIAAMIISAWAVSADKAEKSGEDTGKNDNTGYADTETADNSVPYILTENGGVIIIEHGDKVTVTDISVAAMREYDRELLKDGIKADSMEEALMLMEDFDS